MSRYVPVAETAKYVRAALKSTFPETKFSVRSKSYSGGASVDVFYVDGPRGRDVNRVIERFEGAEFDGMIDLKSHHDTVLSNPDGSVESVRFGADFIHEYRTFSPAASAVVRARFVQEFRIDPDTLPYGLGATFLHRLAVCYDARDGKFYNWDKYGVRGATPAEMTDLDVYSVVTSGGGDWERKILEDAQVAAGVR